LPAIEELEQQEEEKKKKKRINFSSFKGIPSEHRIKMTDSRVLDEKRQESNIKLEDEII